MLRTATDIGKERIGHCTAQKVKDGDEKKAEQSIDPRGSEPQRARHEASKAEETKGAQASALQHFESGSPDKHGQKEVADNFDGSPTEMSGWRLHAPVRGLPAKRLVRVRMIWARTVGRIGSARKPWLLAGCRPRRAASGLGIGRSLAECITVRQGTCR